ncbi:helix-turn-helix transcriptional regulator [Agrobacterium sp. B1(2019)]|nr:helix-turn-helix transcriptional regulator [Agrobacterium sp. B1(2019)]
MGHGKARAYRTASCVEAEPPAHLRNIVDRYISIKSDAPLQSDLKFHALPDACCYLIFDQHNPQIAGVSMLATSSEELDLGREFHFVNVRLFPGVWQSEREMPSYGQIKTSYTGQLPLLACNRRLIGQDFFIQQTILSELMDTLMNQRVVAPNPVVNVILSRLDAIHSVVDMASALSVSTRQLQRILKRATGFAPHDLLKILKLQKALRGEHYGDYYVDQSHFIHSFRKATGYTPGRYAKKFDV